MFAQEWLKEDNAKLLMAKQRLVAGKPAGILHLDRTTSTSSLQDLIEQEQAKAGRRRRSSSRRSSQGESLQ